MLLFHDKICNHTIYLGTSGSTVVVTTLTSIVINGVPIAAIIVLNAKTDYLYAFFHRNINVVQQVAILVI